ncbi:MAG: hypothetical protein M2R45_01540 [Verrucomicrobia subdivision 3 bacterium]|nr:hypothetical protein [Limisphaerales bacterium]MCS1413332.1 hypothetical protein [Limisphaerales bacterium]
MKHIMKHSLLRSLLIAVTVLAQTSIAANEFILPDWANDENAQFSEWLNFTSAAGEPGNAPDVDGSNAGGLLAQSAPGAIVTGSGNIYNPAAASVFSITNESATAYTTVILQTRIIGGIDPDSVALEYEKKGQTESLTTDATELSRKSEGFGDTVVNQWIWELSGLDVRQFTIRYNATAPHASLVSVRLDTLQEREATGDPFEVSFNQPSQDRWNYPFNATPGVRARASLFRAADPEVGIDRHGTYIIGFDSSVSVPKGKAPGAYEIVSAQLRLQTSDNFEVPYDPTYDPVLSHLPETHDARIDDEDPGRPIHVFGTSFRNDFDTTTWDETSPFSPGGEADRTVFPAVLNKNGIPVDVTLAVDYANPTDIAPFATGQLADTEPGEPIPADTWMSFDIDVSNPATLTYLQQGLAQGDLFFTLTSLNGGGQHIRTFPEFHTSDSLSGEAPQLFLSLHFGEAPSAATPPTITGIRNTNAGITLEFEFEPAAIIGAVSIRWTNDFTTWTEVTDPVIELLNAGMAQWTDSYSKGAMRFYQILSNP